MRAPFVALFALMVCQPLAAQTIRGRTLDAASRGGIPATLVTLVTPQGDSISAALSDEQGRFRLTAAASGEYALRAERLGYVTVTTTTFRLAPGEEVGVEVLLSTDPITLDPLVVTSRRGGQGRLGDHRRRAEWIQRTGLGEVITRQDIDRRPRAFVTDYFHTIPGMRVVGSGFDARVVMRGCAPTVYMDGVRAVSFPLNSVSPSSIEGIEIYRSVSEVPAELRAVSGCGAIAMYTRQGERSTGQWTLLQKIVAIAGGSALGLLLISQF